MSEPLGAFIRKLDTNWRLAMPEPLLEAYPRKLILTPGFDNCVRGYAPKQWDKFDATLQELNPNDPDEGDFVRFFRALATPVTLDGNDRFRFSDALMNWMGVDRNSREVMVFDVGSHLEFWELEHWNRFMGERAPDLRRLARGIFGRDRQAQERESDGAGSPAGDGQ